MVTNCFETYDIDWLLFDSSIYWWDLYLHAIASYLFESRGEGGGTCRPYRPFRLKNWLYLPFLFCLIKIAFILYSGPFTRSLPSIRTIIYFAFAHQSIIIINYSFAYFSYCFFTSCLSLSLSRSDDKFSALIIFRKKTLAISRSLMIPLSLGNKNAISNSVSNKGEKSAR